MELKLYKVMYVFNMITELLIVPYGIETKYNVTLENIDRFF